jgi:hypothetical protein
MFPPVTGGVIEDVRFVSDQRLLAAYYGGVALFSTEPGAPGLLLEYGVRGCSRHACHHRSSCPAACCDTHTHTHTLSLSLCVAYMAPSLTNHTACCYLRCPSCCVVIAAATATAPPPLRRCADECAVHNCNSVAELCCWWLHGLVCARLAPHRAA